MATIGRNAPCPCGSGNKYKKCCLQKHERDAALRRASLPSATGPTWVLEDDGLDDLSNSVVDLIDARRFDEALAACHRLLEEFPEVVDGLERSAMVHSAMGDHAKAADFYRRALAFVTHPSRRDDYEDSDFYQQQIEEEERLAAPC
jgi:tetratricopeptide (TPR) repeat protein